MRARAALLLVLLLLVGGGGFFLLGLSEEGMPPPGEEAGAASPEAPLRGPRGRATGEGAPGIREQALKAGGPARMVEVPGSSGLRARLLQGDRPLEGSKVSLVTKNGASTGRETLSGARGRVRFRGIAAGEFRLRVEGRSVPRNWQSEVFLLGEKEEKDLGDLPIPRAASLSGRILGNEAPLAGVLVRLGGGGFSDFLPPDPGSRPETRTDAGGRFRLEGLEPGEWVLRADHPFFQRLERTVGLLGGEERDLGLLRLEAGLELLGRVVDARGRGLAGATVSPELVSFLRGNKVRGYPRARATKTDEEGNFLLGGLSGSSLRLGVRKKGYRGLYNHSVELGKGPVVLILMELSRISGRVTGREGLDFTKARVHIRQIRRDEKEEGGFPFLTNLLPASCGKEGSFAFARLSKGRYSLQADLPGFGSSRGIEVEVGEGPVQNLELLLVPGPSLEVRVVNHLGQPVSRARVKLLREDPETGGMPRIRLPGLGERSAESGEKGLALLRGAFPGKGRIEVRHQDYVEAEAVPVDLPSTGKVSLRVQLEQGGWIEGLCLSTEGRPLEGETIVFRPRLEAMAGPVRRIRRRIERGGIPGLSERSVVSDGKGEFRSPLLKPGPWTAGFQRGVRNLTFGGGRLRISAGEEEPAGGLSVDAEVRAGSASRVVLRKPRSGSVEGRVTHRGRPVEQARVFLWRKGGDAFDPARARTDPGGRYRFAEVLPGNWLLLAKPESGGMPGEPAEVRMPPTGGREVADLSLGGGSVSGRLVPSRGGRLSGGLRAILEKAARRGETSPTARRMVAVMVRSGGDEEPRMSEMTMRPANQPEPVPVKPDGSFRIDFVPAGRWELRIEGKEGGRKLSKAFELAEDQEKDLGSLALVPTWPVEIAVALPDGKPVPTGFLSVHRLSKDGKNLELVSQGTVRNGRIRLPGLSAGRYKLRMRVFRGNVVDPKPQEADLEVHEGGRVTGSRFLLKR